jgi:hypothetical protein
MKKFVLKNNKIKTNKISLLLIILSLTLIGASTFAFFTYRLSGNTAIAFGKIEIDGSSYVKLQKDITDLLPGDELLNTANLENIQYIVNSNSESLYSRVKFYFDTDSSVQAVKDYATNLTNLGVDDWKLNSNELQEIFSGWVKGEDNYYYYLIGEKVKVLSKNDSLIFASSLIIPNTLKQSIDENGNPIQFHESIKMHIEIEAIQSANIDDSSLTNITALLNQKYNVVQSNPLANYSFSANGILNSYSGSETIVNIPSSYSIKGQKDEDVIITDGTSTPISFDMSPYLTLTINEESRSQTFDVIQQFSYITNAETESPITHTINVGEYSDLDDDPSKFEEISNFIYSLGDGSLTPNYVNAMVKETDFEYLNTLIKENELVEIDPGISGTTSLLGKIIFKNKTYNIVPGNDCQVIGIGSNAFASNIKVQEINLPLSISSIGTKAFYGCSSLSKINLSDLSSLKEISSYLFSGCTNLSNIVLPQSITTIGANAFIGCNSITMLNVPKNVVEIGDSAFANSGLVNMTFDDSSKLTSIASTIIDGTEYYNTISQNFNGFIIIANHLLKSDNDTLSGNIVIPDGVIDFSANLFKNQMSIGSVTLPASLKKIPGWAFYGSSLSSINIPSNLESIGGCAFYNLTSLNCDITIPSTVKRIGSECFYGCKNLRITFAESTPNLEYIGYLGGYTFYNTPYWNNHSGEIYFNNDVFFTYKLSPSSPTQIVIKNGTKRIINNAFSGKTNITSITIPSSIDYIGDEAFTKCSNLTEINVDSNNQYYSSIDGVLYNKDKTKLIAYPNGKTQTSFNIPLGVQEISSNAFMGLTVLNEIIIPSSLNNFGYKAFYDCQKLQNVVINSNIISKKITCPTSQMFPPINEISQEPNNYLLQGVLVNGTIKVKVGDSTNVRDYLNENYVSTDLLNEQYFTSPTQVINENGNNYIVFIKAKDTTYSTSTAGMKPIIND